MKPMLCEKFTPEEARKLSNEWVLEPKFDGVRAYIKDGLLYDRRGQEITAKFPEFTGINKIKDTIDGEIISLSGEFNDISGRMHLKDAFKIKLIAKNSPAIFMAFDIVMQGDLQKRREKLLTLEPNEWLNISPQYEVSEFENLWEGILNNRAEGLVAKRKDSVYEFKRSTEWRKIKAFVEIEATFTKLDKHSHGVRLETNDGKSININGYQARIVEQIFSTNGEVVCEVQYLPQNNSDAWRFPSFRGIKK